MSIQSTKIILNNVNKTNMHYYITIQHLTKIIHYKWSVTNFDAFIEHRWMRAASLN